MQYKHRFCFSPLLSALLVALLSACSSADGLAGRGDDATEDYAVTFAASDGWKEVEGTRGGDASSSASGDASSASANGSSASGDASSASGNVSSFAPGDAFGLFAYHNASATPDFMNNQRVTFDGASWTYSPTKYWPRTDGDRLSFYATSPYSAIAAGDVSVAATADGHPTAVYDNTRADIDWTVAKREAVTYATGKDGVSLPFQHLTARVKFRFIVVGETEGEDYRPVVHLLQYDAPHIVGTTQFEGGDGNPIACAYADQSNLVTLKRFVSLPEGVSVSKDGTIIDEFTAYLFPCSFPCSGNAATVGPFTISLNNVAYTVTPKDQITVERGKSYTVNFNIEKTNNTSNFFITSYSIWEDGGVYEGTLE